jgi:hypothetical protein
LEETLLDLLTVVVETFIFDAVLCPCRYTFCRQGEYKKKVASSEILGRRMSLISDWQGYIPPNCRVSQSTAHLVHVKPSIYMPAPHGRSQNNKAPGNVFYEEMWPLFFMLKVAGFFPYCVSSSGKLHMR